MAKRHNENEVWIKWNVSNVNFVYHIILGAKCFLVIVDIVLAESYVKTD